MSTCAGDRDSLWPHTYDTEQLYDLEADPNQKVNLITDSTFSAEIAHFESLMREYIADVCPAQNGLTCFMPDFRFGTPEPTAPTTAPIQTPQPTKHPAVAGETVPTTKEPTANPVVLETLEIVGQLTLNGRFDTLRQYLKANDITTAQFGEVCLWTELWCHDAWEHLEV